MLITKVSGHKHLPDVIDNVLESDVEWIELDWDELNKRILRKSTNKGRDVAISLPEGESLKPGDILYQDEQQEILVLSKEERVYVIYPQDMIEMGKTAFELGNRHTPCLIEKEEILVRYDATLERIFKEIGVKYEQEWRRFNKPFAYKGHHHH